MKNRVIFAGLFLSLWIGAGNARAEVLTTPVAGPLMLEVDGEVQKVGFPAGDGRGLYFQADDVKEIFGISVLDYPDGTVILQGGDTKVTLIDEVARNKSGLLIPVKIITDVFGYEMDWKMGSNRITFQSPFPGVKTAESRRKRMLPSEYDYREEGRAPKVKNQGQYGTCWSFASLTALESAGLPKIDQEYSVDHMSLQNSFALEQEEGGEYTMSMAYLLAWQGPVLEEEDPYGDQYSPDGLKPSLHVQEIQMPPDDDRTAIKESIFLYGGVQSSLYMSMTDSSSHSVYYNENQYAYCYAGDEVPNHDVVIIGWDDHYPRENFQMELEGDGAFLCQNSWGSEFGDGGRFWVSYYDQYIGKTNLVYTGLEKPEDSEKIYQSDLCGWVGQMGYGREDAYGANVYEVGKQETLHGAGFYATGEHTSYEIYVARDLEHNKGFQKRQLVAKGEARYSGYYTVKWDQGIDLEPGERFAVILYVKTPGAVHPLAIEYRADDATSMADIDDGEGYISAGGAVWERAEESYQCNLCLKAYTTIRR